MEDTGELVTADVESVATTSQQKTAKSSQDKVSISPTFYELLFRTKLYFKVFLWLQFGFVIFCQKNIVEKAAPKMLVTLTKGCNEIRRSARDQPEKWNREQDDPTSKHNNNRNRASDQGYWGERRCSEKA